MIAVVPLAGTWIETVLRYNHRTGKQSFPLRERGLKPLMPQSPVLCSLRRSPCGNVD